MPMKILRFTLLSLILLQIVFTGCSKKNTVDAAAYKIEREQWQMKRAEGLKKENGWLTLSGLFWLKEGENKFGADSSNTVIFPPGKSPGRTIAPRRRRRLFPCRACIPPAPPGICPLCRSG